MYGSIKLCFGRSIKPELHFLNKITQIGVNWSEMVNARMIFSINIRRYTTKTQITSAGINILVTTQVKLLIQNQKFGFISRISLFCANVYNF